MRFFRILFPLIVVANVIVLVSYNLNLGSVAEISIAKLPITNKTLHKSSKSSCAFPKIAYNDIVALEYLKKDYELRKLFYIKCENNKNSTEIVHKMSNLSPGHLIINETLVKKTFGLRLDQIECSVTRFDRVTNNNDKVVDHEKIYFNNSQVNLTKHGFYHLRCDKINKSMLYENVYTIWPSNMSILMNDRKKYVEYEEKLRKPLNLTYGEPVRLEQKNELKIDKKQNVLIIGFDSVSQNHFRRVFPLTYDYLKNQKGQSKVFEKYTSVGYNTYPNIMPLLSGVSIYTDLGKYKKNDDTYHDQFPFIWYEYEKSGDYFTSFQEDAPLISIINMGRRGFRYQPTAFKGRPFWWKHDYKLGKCNPNKLGTLKPHYKTYINLMESLLERLFKEKLPFFSFNFLTDFTHESLSIPPEMDKAFYDMFKRYEQKGYLKDTLLIVFSDHGNRMAKFHTETLIGRLEMYLPFLSIRLPDVLRNTQLHRNFVSNADKLIANYDVHQTLRHFLHLNIEQTINGLNTSQYRTNNPLERHLRGISLFEKIPSDRTCSNALIPTEFCPCYQRTNINENQFKKQTKFNFAQVTNLIIKTIENYTESIKDLCYKYTFDKVDSSKHLVYDNHEMFNFVIILQPGDAYVEANIEVKQSVLRVRGKLNRISKYGNQSSCVLKQYAFLKLFCFCKSIAIDKSSGSQRNSSTTQKKY